MRRRGKTGFCLMMSCLLIFQSAACSGGEEEQTAESYRKSGILWMEQEEYELAAEDFLSALDLAGAFPDESDYDSLNFLCEAYYFLDDYENCSDTAKRLMKLSCLTEDDIPFVNDLAVRLAEEDNPGEAKDLLDVAIDTFPAEEVQVLRYNRAVLSEELESAETAMTLLASYCADYPFDEAGAEEAAAFAACHPEIDAEDLSEVKEDQTEEE